MTDTPTSPAAADTTVTLPEARVAAGLDPEPTLGYVHHVLQPLAEAGVTRAAIAYVQDRLDWADDPSPAAKRAIAAILADAQANRVAIAERMIERVILEHHYHPETRTCECGTRMSMTGGIYYARHLAIEIADAQEAKR